MYEISENDNLKILRLNKIADLKCGENSHQYAKLYNADLTVAYTVLNDKKLGYNNILNLTEVLNLASEFYDVNAVAIVRHTKPCGVALGRTIYEAYTKAFDCDPMSSYNGTVGFSQTVDYDSAKHLNSMAVEAVIAPDYEPKALELLKENAHLKIVQLNSSLKSYKKMLFEEIKVTPFGVLLQNRDDADLDVNKFKVVTRVKPTVEQVEDSVFGWKVVKHAKTNSAVVVKDLQTLAIGQGYTNALAAIEGTLNVVADSAKDAILVSDEMISSEDCIYAAVQNRIGLIIQPGGSMKDDKIIEMCDKYDISMIMTGISSYKH